MTEVCLAILNYNGKRHLEHLLPSVSKVLHSSSARRSFVLLDNRSTEDDVEWLQSRFLFVKVILAPENVFLFSYNWILRGLYEKWVVLLNNDLRLHEHFLEPLLKHFESPDVFSVSAASFDWEGTRITSGPARLTFRNGFYDWPFDISVQVPSHTLFTSGGFMAVDRQKFLKLGGFSRLYSPAYCEDLDLCFRG